MDFDNLINTSPLASLFFGLSILTINYLFSYKLSNNFVLIKNKNLNFVFFNISYYLLLTPILLLLLFFQIEIFYIRYFVYVLILFQIIFLFHKKNLNLKSFSYFYKLEYLVISFFLLFTISQVTDADSLDYHLGSVMEIIRSERLQIRSDDWFHFRLIGFGEMINFYGLLFSSKNFGQLFQILSFSNLIILFKTINKNSKLNYVIILSFPIFASLMLSAKQLLIVSNCYLLFLAFFLINQKLEIKTIIIILILIISPIGFKHSYIIYSLPLWIFLFLKSYKEFGSIKILFFSFVIFLILPGILFYKNFNHFGDPISPFMEFLKHNPNLDILNFAKELRYSTKIFSYFEFPLIPFLHIIPVKVSEISLIVSPLAISFYIIFLIKEKREYVILLSIIYILLFFSGKSQSRYYLDLYFLSTMFLLNSKYFNFLISKLRYIFLLNLPYIVLTIGIVFYSIISLSFPIFNKIQYERSMNAKAHNYEIVSWLNKKIKKSEIVLYDLTIRSKTHQNHKFVYYEINSRSKEELRNIVDANNIDKIVLNEYNYNNFVSSYYNCEITDKKILSKATRNPVNSKKHIANIFILDTTCLIW